MKELNDETAFKLCQSDPLHQRCFNCARQQVGAIATETVVLPSVERIDLSHNTFIGLDAALKDLCPNLRYVNASYNRIRYVDQLALPVVLGALNLVSNDFPSLEAVAAVLRPVHILRLNLADDHVRPAFFTSAAAYRDAVLGQLPYVWCLDDDFVTSTERLRVEVGAAAAPRPLELWDAREPSDRELAMLRLIQSLPFGGRANDNLRLDVLLEDYLEEAEMHNAHASAHSSSSSASSSSGAAAVPMPTVDVALLLRIPHKTRLDLSVMLTVSIHFDLPEKLLKDSLVVLLLPHMAEAGVRDLVALPLFVRTAVVNLIRRTCVREIDELRVLQQLLPKPGRGKAPARDTTREPLTYLSARGFRHLRPFRRFLERPLERPAGGAAATATDAHTTTTTTTTTTTSSSSSSSSDSRHLEFTELEMTILKDLPDVPTRASRAGAAAMASSYRDWLSFAARHAIFMLGKAAGFPSLTRNFDTAKDQALYDKLLPLIRVAKMTHADLDIELTGPAIDGRGRAVQFVPQPSRAAAAASAAAAVSEAAAARQRALKFGVGLPRGSPHDLHWIQHQPAGVYLRKPASRGAGGSVIPDGVPISRASSAAVTALRAHLDDLGDAGRGGQRPPSSYHKKSMSLLTVELEMALRDAAVGEMFEAVPANNAAPGARAVHLFNDSVMTEDTPPESPKMRSIVGKDVGGVASVSGLFGEEGAGVAGNTGAGDSATVSSSQMQQLLAPPLVTSSTAAATTSQVQAPPLHSPTKQVVLFTDEAERKPFFVLSPSGVDPHTYHVTGSVHHHYHLLPTAKQTSQAQTQASYVKGDLRWEVLDPAQPSVLTIGAAGSSGAVTGDLGVLSVLGVIKASARPQPSPVRKLQKPQAQSVPVQVPVPMPAPSEPKFRPVEARKQLLRDLGTLRNLSSFSESKSRDLDIVAKTKNKGPAANAAATAGARSKGRNKDVHGDRSAAQPALAGLNQSWVHLVANRTRAQAHAHAQAYAQAQAEADARWLQDEGEAPFQYAYEYSTDFYDEHQELGESVAAEGDPMYGPDGRAVGASGAPVPDRGPDLAQLEAVRAPPERHGEGSVTFDGVSVASAAAASHVSSHGGGLSASSLSHGGGASQTRGSKGPIVFDDEDDRSLDDRTLPSVASPEYFAALTNNNNNNNNGTNDASPQGQGEVVETSLSASLTTSMQLQGLPATKLIKVFSLDAQRSTEHADRNVNGRNLGQTWYPQHDKHILRCARPGPFFAAPSSSLSSLSAADNARATAKTFMKKGARTQAHPSRTTLAGGSNNRASAAAAQTLYELDRPSTPGASLSGADAVLPPLPVDRGAAAEKGKGKSPFPRGPLPKATQQGLHLRGHTPAGGPGEPAAAGAVEMSGGGGGGGGESVTGSLGSLSALKVLSPPLAEPHPSVVLADSFASSTQSIGSLGELTAASRALVETGAAGAAAAAAVVMATVGPEGEKERLPRSRPTSSSRPHAPSAGTQKLPVASPSGPGKSLTLSVEGINVTSPQSSPTKPAKRQLHSLATVKVSPSRSFAVKTQRDAVESKDGVGKSPS